MIEVTITVEHHCGDASLNSLLANEFANLSGLLALVALLHDVCKVNFYTVEMRNKKNDETGQWEKVPFYAINDTLPYGHGEKSVYILSGFFYGENRLTREEAFAIRYHMGFSYGGTEERGTIGRALEMYPLALALNVADMEASYFMEGSNK